jgi:hypothetical protein
MNKREIDLQISVMQKQFQSTIKDAIVNNY